MVPPLKPLPGGTLTDEVANGPRLASMPATVGSGPRWYGLSEAACGWAEAGYAVVNMTRAATANMTSLTDRTRNPPHARPGPCRDVPAVRMVLPPHASPRPFQRWDVLGLCCPIHCEACRVTTCRQQWPLCA